MRTRPEPLPEAPLASVALLLVGATAALLAAVWLFTWAASVVLLWAVG